MSRQTKRLFSYSKHDKVVLGYLVTPSWFSGIVDVAFSTAVVLWASVTFIHYDGSTLSGTLSQLFTLGHSNKTSVINTYQTLGNNFSASTLISDIPLFIFWAGVGLVVYSFATNVVKSLQNVADVTAQLKYVNANRRELIFGSLEHLLIRALVLAAWFGLLRYTTHILLPYVIALTHVGLGSTSKALTFGYMIGGIVLLSIFLHLHTVMLRLLLLKPRVFWRSSYD